MGVVTDALSRIGVRTLIDEQDYSCVLRSWCLPEGMSYRELHDTLKSEGFIIYAGQGNLATEIFRLSFMGDITDDEMSSLTGHLEAILGSQGS